MRAQYSHRLSPVPVWDVGHARANSSGPRPVPRRDTVASRLSPHAWVPRPACKRRFWCSEPDVSLGTFSREYGISCTLLGLGASLCLLDSVLI